MPSCSSPGSTKNAISAFTPKTRFWNAFERSGFLVTATTYADPGPRPSSRTAQSSISNRTSKRGGRGRHTLRQWTCPVGRHRKCCNPSGNLRACFLLHARSYQTRPCGLPGCAGVSRCASTADLLRRRQPGERPQRSTAGNSRRTSKQGGRRRIGTSIGGSAASALGQTKTRSDQNKKAPHPISQVRGFAAPPAGLEPATVRLTVGSSAN